MMGARDTVGIAICSVGVLSLCFIFIWLFPMVVSSHSERQSRCNTITYSVGNTITEIDCVSNLYYHSDADSHSFIKDNVKVYIRPDVLIVKEHTHE